MHNMNMMKKKVKLQLINLIFENLVIIDILLLLLMRN